MFNKLIFERKLGINSSEGKWVGLKIAFVSFVIVVSGFVFSIFIQDDIGRWISKIGIGGFFTGGLLHLFILFSRFSG